MADPESYNPADIEIRRLRQGIWDMATEAGMDTDGDTTPDAIRGDIVELGLEEVRELRESYGEVTDDAVKAHRELVATVERSRKLAEALEWYADPDNWDDMGPAPWWRAHRALDESRRAPRENSEAVGDGSEPRDQGHA